MIHHIEKGSVEFWHINIGLFFGGFVTFAVLYCMQPLLPLYAREFHVTPMMASLVISVTTALLAVMMTFTASLSNAWGRKGMMVCSLFGASFITIVSGLSVNFVMLLLCRALEGIVLAGIPAIAMAYLGEEVAPRHLGTAMGIYISGNAIGGMLGRIAAGVMTDLSSWRIAILCIGLVGLFCSWWFWRYLPSSTHFVAQPFSAREHLSGLLQQLQDPGQLCLYGVGFLLMGSFVTLYSYLGYQLTEPPYNLSQSLIGWIFAIYIVGSLGSSCLSSLADRYAQHKILLLSIALIGIGALITLNASLIVKICGVALVTFGFFGGHAIASSWVGKRAAMGKAQASALYLFFYYVGSSVGNTAGGFFWSMNGWDGVIMMIVSFVLGNILLALLLPAIPVRPQK